MDHPRLDDHQTETFLTGTGKPIVSRLPSASLSYERDPAKRYNSRMPFPPGSIDSRLTGSVPGFCEPGSSGAKGGPWSSIAKKSVPAETKVRKTMGCPGSLR